MVNKYSGSGRKREKGMDDGDGDGRGGRCKNYDTEGETAVTAVIENVTKRNGKQKARARASIQAERGKWDA